MLALAMALLSAPTLLLIDELSLGLAPIVVEGLLESVRSLRAAGTAVLLVEQSVNVAVAVADRVYVMDSGVIRFSGSARRSATARSSSGPSSCSSRPATDPGAARRDGRGGSPASRPPAPAPPALPALRGHVRLDDLRRNQRPR